MKSAVFLSTAEGYISHELPSEIQYAPVYAIAQIDKGIPSKGVLFFGGNQFLVKPQFGRYDASKGWVVDYSINQNKIVFESPKILGERANKTVENCKFTVQKTIANWN